MPRRTANNQLARAGEGRAGEVLAASATVMAAQDALPPPASVALAKSPLPDTAIVPVARATRLGAGNQPIRQLS